MAIVDRDQVATADELLARVQAHISTERSWPVLSDAEVGRILPELLELAEAFPVAERRPLCFPPLLGGPALAGR